MLTSSPCIAEIEVLNYGRFHYPCPTIQKKLHAVYLKIPVGGSDTVIGLMCDNSVSHWVKIYNLEGITPLYVNNYGTNKSDLQACSEFQAICTR